jgi:predicted outer membrane protein
MKRRNMKGRYLSIILIVAVLLGSAAAPSYSEERTLSESELMATVSIDDGTLEAEAAQLGVPESQTKRYVVDMKSLNNRFQAGALTNSEYVRAKRDLIENLM